MDRHAEAIAEGDFGRALQSGVTDPTFPQRQTSLIVDPPNGKLPDMTAEGKRLSALMKSSWALPGETQTWDWVDDFDSWDRCITRGMPSSMMPFRYNNGVEIMQAPGYVILNMEMIHEARIVPVDGRPGISPKISQWMGESRGRWEGNTLVIETTNYKPGASATNIGVMGSPQGNRFPTSEKMKTIERLTRLNKDMMLYSITTEDPVVVTRPGPCASRCGTIRPTSGGSTRATKATAPFRTTSTPRVQSARPGRAEPGADRAPSHWDVLTAATLVAWSVTTPAAIPDPVATETGRLSGVTLKSGVRAFKGIPFAAPPLGPLRWKEPQPAAKWDGVRKAEQFGNVCVQPSQLQRVPNNVSVDLPDSPKTSEDCLYLNVWTSAGRAGAPPAGDGVDLRRRLHRRRRLDAAQRRREPGEEGRRPGDVQLPRRRVRVLLTPRADQGIRPQRLRQPGAGRLDRRTALGAEEHRGLWRRPEQRHHLRRIRRRGDGWRPGGVAGSEGPVPPRDRESGAWMGLGMGAMAPLAGAEQSATQPPPGRGGRGGRRRHHRCRCRRWPSCARAPPRKW